MKVDNFWILVSGRFHALFVESKLKAKCYEHDVMTVTSSSPAATALRSTTTTERSLSALLQYRTSQRAGRGRGRGGKARRVFGLWPTPCRNSRRWPVLMDSSSGTTSAGTITRARRRSRWKPG